jgi:hypothetical protein
MVAILSSVALILSAVFAIANSIPGEVLLLLALIGQIIQNQDRYALKHQMVMSTMKKWEKVDHVTM